MTCTDGNRQVYGRAGPGLFLDDTDMAKIPDFVRLKKQPLRLDECDKIACHPLQGIKDIQNFGVKFSGLEQYILEHHERLGGSGYSSKKEKLSFVLWQALTMP